MDELAIELSTIRWAVRQYVSRLDLASAVPEAAVDWQVEKLIERFDGFIATYLYSGQLEKEIAATKQNYRELLNLYRTNALYPIFKLIGLVLEQWGPGRFR